MAEKLLALKQVNLTSKRDVVSAYNQVTALQEEIESSRERAEGIIEVSLYFNFHLKNEMGNLSLGLFYRLAAN